MIYIPIIIIVVTILIDFYFTSSNRFELFNIDQKIAEPWSKIEINDEKDGSKYYININEINKYIKKLNIWKELTFINTSNNDYNPISIEDDYVVFNTNKESDALVLCNLVINNLNNNITMDEIITNNLIKKSMNKAKKYDMVSIKLRELIKEGLIQLNNNDTTEIEDLVQEDLIQENFIQETSINKEPEVINKIENDNILNSNIRIDNISPVFSSKFIPYEGSEYATISF